MRARTAPLAPFASLALVTLVVAGCGRSSPDPCRAREGLSCEQLADERALEEVDFDAAVVAVDGDAVSREGACVQALVAEQLERVCLNDPCAELCALHPCALQGAGEGEECLARCNAVVDGAQIPRAALDAAILRAADRPGLCSCAVCDDATAKLCTDLWVCGP